jgi:hypothetical protein
VSDKSSGSGSGTVERIVINPLSSSCFRFSKNSSIKQRLVILFEINFIKFFAVAYVSSASSSSLSFVETITAGAFSSLKSSFLEFSGVVWVV